MEDWQDLADLPEPSPAEIQQAIIMIASEGDD